MAMPRMLFSPRLIAPARAETSPSFATTTGISPKGVPHGADVDVLHLRVEELGRDLQEEARDHRAVVYIDARAGDADGVHARHMRGGGLEGADYALVVVVRSSVTLGYQTTSSEKTLSPSMTALTLRSLRRRRSLCGSRRDGGPRPQDGRIRPGRPRTSRPRRAARRRSP